MPSDLQFLPLSPKAAQDKHVHFVPAGQLSERHAGGLPLVLVPATPFHRDACGVGHVLLGERGLEWLGQLSQILISYHFIWLQVVQRNTL